MSVFWKQLCGEHVEFYQTIYGDFRLGLGLALF